MSDPITRLNAALEGRYRIERQLGEGGMATVYLADDLRHERKVALKVLKPELAAVVGADRFLAEIKTTANLQHPHILPLFDSGEADGFLFYVMPYVEGESLRERLDREHQLPVHEAVQIVKDVAEALQAAHDQGVIHRDIKPANILLSKGRPLVSDFGIALALGAAGAGRLTETGLSLGTPHYMSPEQATGDLGIGAPTDIYALGCVLYEMLVGEPPYTGSTPQAILGRIITVDAPLASAERKSVPPSVDAVIRRALEKLPADRFATARHLAEALRDTGFRYGAIATTTPPGADSLGWKRLAIASTMIALALALVSVWALRRPQPVTLVARFESPFSPGPQPSSFAAGSFTLSPDGSLLVYVGPGAGSEPPGDNQLWARRLNNLDAAPIRGTERGFAPAVSPDGERLVFDQDGDIKVLSLAGGPTTTLAEGVYPRWGSDGYIYFTVGREQTGLEIRRVPASGGAPEIVRPLAAGEEGYVWDVLPGSDVALMFFRRSVEEPWNIGAVRLATGETTQLFPGSLPRYVAPGHLIFETADRSLAAAPFDIESLAAGSPVTLIDNVWNAEISRAGSLMYSTRPSLATSRTRLVLVEPGGSQEVLTEVSGMAWFPRFSPDGSRVAYGVSAGLTLTDDSDLWLVDLSRRARTRVTAGGNNRFYPIWTPDGSMLIHADGQGSENRVLSSMADGSLRSDTVLTLGARRFPTSWSPDGLTLAYQTGPAGTPTSSRDIWMLQMNGEDRTALPFIETEFGERGPIFSPDGAWVAYVSDKSGQNDIYARPYPGPGPEVTISVDGGSEPVWGPIGDRLFYRRDTELVVVDVAYAGASLTVGTPRRVMEDQYLRDLGAQGGVAYYDVAPTGERFVVVEEVAPDDAIRFSHLYLVQNWVEELRQRVPLD